MPAGVTNIIRLLEPRQHTTPMRGDSTDPILITVSYRKQLSLLHNYNSLAKVIRLHSDRNHDSTLHTPVHAAMTRTLREKRRTTQRATPFCLEHLAKPAGSTLRGPGDAELAERNSRRSDSQWGVRESRGRLCGSKKAKQRPEAKVWLRPPQRR